MRVSYRWLSEFVDLQLDPDELAEQLTMAGLEVDSVKKVQTHGSVVGEIVELSRKGNLCLAKVNIGSRELDIVTADSSVEKGQKYPVVLAGSKVGDRVIEKRRFGDFVSEGMMLSAEEMGIEEDSTTLLKLDGSFANGTPLDTIDEFDDYIIELELTPNRADALSILGIAREVRALTGADIRMPELTYVETDRRIDEVIGVEVKSPRKCPRYTLYVADVEVKEAPFVIRLRLMKSGIRPINSVVDITNYVLMALGQPLHAFDLNRLEGNIIVRDAMPNEEIVALDGKSYKLDGTMLVIADEKKPVAIAGVMGSEDSSVIETTGTIALESAHFDPVSIRLTARKLKLHTEASHRFERGVDPNLCLVASQYALSLLCKHSGASVYRGYIDAKSTEFEPLQLNVSPKWVNEFLGSDFDEKQMVEVLKRLGFEPKKEQSDIVVRVPTYRFDIGMEADIAEEIARIIGYDKIDSTLPVVHSSFKDFKPVDRLKRSVTKTLADLGLHEVINYAFVNSVRLELFDRQRERFLFLKNPLVEDQNVMRTTLLVGMMENLKLNISKGARSVAVFETGRVFFKKDSGSEEYDRIAALMWGLAEFSWFESQRFFDFYDIKAISDAIAKLCGLRFNYRPSQRVFLHPGRSAEVYVDEENVGFVGELHPDVYDAYQIRFDRKARILVCELDLARLAQMMNLDVKYVRLPRLPTVVRDLAIVVDKSIPASEIQLVIESFEPVFEVVLFDVYDRLEDNSKRSLTFRIVLKNDAKTFTDQEIDEIISEIFERLKERFNATLRG